MAEGESSALATNLVYTIVVRKEEDLSEGRDVLIGIFY